MAFSIIEQLSSPTALFTVKGGLTAGAAGITTVYANIGAANANAFIITYAGAEIMLDDNTRYFRNKATNAWIPYLTTVSYSLTVESLSPLFSTIVSNPTATTWYVALTLSNASPGTVYNNSSGGNNPPTFTANMALGETAVTGGSVKLRSATSGSGEMIIQLVGASGNYNFNMPLSAGSIGQVLTSQGGGSTAMTWTTLSSGGFVTANNGLTASTATNVQLGGTLIQTTNINAAGFNLSVTSSVDAVNPFFVSAVGEAAIYGFSTLTAGRFTASNSVASAVGVIEVLGSSGGLAGTFTTVGAATNTVISLLRLTQAPSGTTTAGTGLALDFYLKPGANAAQIAQQFISKWTDVTNKNCEFSIKLSHLNVMNERFVLSSTGALKLNAYGVGAFTGTAAYMLQVDSSGNIIEGSPAGGGGTTGTYTPALTNAANVSNSTAYVCQYLAVTDSTTGLQVVTVSGKFAITFTTGGTTTRLGIELPISSDVQNDQEIGGVAGSNSLTNGSFAVRGDITNNRAEFYATAPGNGTSETYWFTFTYVVNIP